MALYNYIINEGVIIADTSEILTEVQNEYLAQFGADLNVNPETPQGVLINAEALARAAVAANNAALANQINPNLAGGVFLDAIYQLTGGQRAPATASTVTANVTGVAGTIIPTTASASLSTGELFSPVALFTIGSGGTASALFQAQQTGPISVPIGSLVRIVDGVSGWETVNNSEIGTLGTNVQSDQSLQRLRQQTLALQGTALPEAITSELYGNGSGLTSLTFRENVTNGTLVIDGVTMVEHSIYVCVTNDAPLDFVQIYATVTGDAATVIPITAVAEDGDGNQYSPIAPITIETNGAGNGIFQALVEGPTNTTSGDLTVIVDGVTGWDTVTNPYASSAYAYAFLYDVAYTLLDKKSAGAAWNGGPGTAPYGPQNIGVTDPTTGQIYNVTFGVPTPILIQMIATVTVTNAFTGDPIQAVKDAILNYAAGGLENDPGFIIGADVSCFELAASISIQVPGIFVNNFQTDAGGGYSNDTIPIAIWEQAVTSASAILVQVTYSAISR